MMYERGREGFEGAVSCFRDGFSRGGYMMSGGYFSLFHMIFGLIVVIAIIVAIVLLVRSRKKLVNNPTDELLFTLKQRYVNGEISEEEYLQKKAVLTKK